MKRKLWDPRSFALQGGFLGIFVGTILVMSEAFWPDFDASEPFYYAILEVVGCGVAGSLLLAASAWIRNRMVRA
ncbi:hypothetical protein [Microvirga sp. TS319]|uniref:hypothetical protein n=1 Tax=Microvirga sp. TS319 TaxID=3241165 RepID=UPI00351AA080